MSRKEQPFLEKLKRFSKNQILIGGLAGVLLLIIAIPTDSGKSSMEKERKEGKQETGLEETERGRYEKKMESRLKAVLEEMEGVGKAEVMITLKDGGESIVEKDRTVNSQKSEEEEEGRKQSVTENQSQEETVLSRQQGSTEQPFISREVTPRVEGVLVVAEGGDNSKVVKNISDAVLALFSVEIHKIKVVKMNR